MTVYFFNKTNIIETKLDKTGNIQQNRVPHQSNKENFEEKTNEEAVYETFRYCCGVFLRKFRYWYCIGIANVYQFWYC